MKKKLILAVAALALTSAAVGTQEKVSADGQDWRPWSSVYSKNNFTATRAAKKDALHTLSVMYNGHYINLEDYKAMQTSIHRGRTAHEVKELIQKFQDSCGFWY